ncbi:MAG: transcription termination/antitermination protein NusG [Acholeplasmataceae bacterium]|jgi:transcriptional antiterminator NusG|nr:transcription termination/antitermination protein NusG [Acholeplasmataceae bacterium]MDD4193745.1 transcription termination/antitermination protein NusG [Acholeplasmataceae bacterium]
MSKAVRWYIIQTYSGYENAVKTDLLRRVESMGMSDYIFRVVVPEETVIEKKADGKEKEKVKQLFPGYVFVEMMVTDESWFVVRNTPRVTGFLGSSGGGTKPVPLAPDEINQILLKVGIITKPTYDHLLGKTVEVISGTWLGLKGEVVSVDNDQEKIIVDLDLFGRATPTEFDVLEVKEL